MKIESSINRRKLIAFFIASLAGFLAANNVAATISDVPLFVSEAAKPLVMLTMSKDHQLFFKAYNDFSDLIGTTAESPKDGIPETTYAHHFTYYGYFDSKTCYDYDTGNGRFVPKATADSSNYCDTVSGAWSGNFLNWITMSRMDVVRKVLYGGKRSTDTDSLTVLERAALPTDGHSWAKYYNGSDFNKLTPFTTVQVSTNSGTAANDGITFCNTTPATSGLSHTTTAAPIMQVAKGNFSLWDAHEGRECQWDNGNSNGNDPDITEIYANASAPQKSSHGLGSKDYVVRMEVCGSTLYGNEAETCELYPKGNLKPIGLLQNYADNVEFGLLTGSYSNHIAGGVLRKNISDISGEIDADTGVFEDVDGIVKTIDLLRVYGYQYDDGNYLSNGGDNCNFRETLLVDGECTSWGNPISEMFLETVRYFAGENATSAFTSGIPNGSDDRIPDLISVSWQDPLNTDNYCASLSTIVINASVSNYDGDNLGGFSDLSAKSLDSYVDLIGTQEGLAGKSLFVGETASEDDKACSPKTVANLSEVAGICPEAGVLEGTYDVSGLAYFARTNDLRPDPAMRGDQNLNTYAVALSPVVPKINLSVNGKPVVILPSLYYRHGTGTGGVDNTISGGSLIDFKIARQNATDGKYLLNWEISSAGGDYDQDIISTMEYSVSGNQVKVSTQIIQRSLGTADVGIGYVISGTTQDGLHLHSGLDGFDYTDSTGATACVDCVETDAASSHTYEVGGSGAILPQSPLYYAAKYGRFIEEGSNSNDLPDLDAEWDSDSDGEPDNYFFVEDPSVLVTELRKVLDAIVKRRASAASVASNSASLRNDTVIYHSQFNSGAWEGDLEAVEFKKDGTIGQTFWNAQEVIQGMNWQTGRRIITYEPTADSGAGAAIPFLYDSLNSAQQASLNINPVSYANDGNGEDRVKYLRGDQSREMKTGKPDAIFRSRDFLLGDFINSTPLFIGPPSAGYPENWPGTADEDSVSYLDFTIANADRTPVIYVGGNDGMLHAFNAKTDAGGGRELFAYVPNEVIPNLNQLTSIAYNHTFYVDGSPTVLDAFYSGAWHSVLVGGLRAGGQGYFALDVTDPDGISEANLPDVLWEFTDEDDADLGYSFSQPSIVRLNNGEWAAVFGNGYDSTISDGNVGTGEAVLYIVYLEGGLDGQWTTGDYVKISTKTGTPTNPNGLSTPAPVDEDGDFIVDYFYAGDLQGNLWKFDVSGSTSQWGSAFKSGQTPEPLFVAKDENGKRQPITVRPEVAKNSHGTGFMVYFGTGKYFEEGDNFITGATTQTFYGVIDTNGSQPVPFDRDDLLVQTIVEEKVETYASLTREVRIISQNNLQPGTHRGWMLDLLSPDVPIGFDEKPGERTVSDPVYRETQSSTGERFPVIVFTTIWPSPASCDAGGKSWIMELDARTGAMTPDDVLDVNKDGTIDDKDRTSDGEVVNGIREEGIVPKLTIIDAGDTEYKIGSSSASDQETGETEVIVIKERSATDQRGRLYWQQLK